MYLFTLTDGVSFGNKNKDTLDIINFFSFVYYFSVHVTDYGKVIQTYWQLTNTKQQFNDIILCITKLRKRSICESYLSSIVIQIYYPHLETHVNVNLLNSSLDIMSNESNLKTKSIFCTLYYDFITINQDMHHVVLEIYLKNYHDI